VEESERAETASLLAEVHLTRTREVAR
jgi:hypothetical protein